MTETLDALPPGALTPLARSVLAASGHARDMHAFGVTAAELEAILAREVSEMRQYAGEFTRLLALRAELSATFRAMLRDREREASLR